MVTVSSHAWFEVDLWQCLWTAAAFLHSLFSVGLCKHNAHICLWCWFKIQAMIGPKHKESDSAWTYKYYKYLEGQSLGQTFYCSVAVAVMV